MLEMSRRVGGAESRCQAQSVGHAPGLGWLNGGPVRSSIFVENNRRRPIFENLPMFPAQEPAGGRAIVPQIARTGADPWVLESLRPLGPGQRVTLSGLSASMSSHAVLAREVV